MMTNFRTSRSGQARRPQLSPELNTSMSTSTGSANSTSTSGTATATIGSTAEGSRGCMTRWRCVSTEVAAPAIPPENHVQAISPTKTKTG